MRKRYKLYEGVGRIADNHHLETKEVIGKRLEITGEVNGYGFTMMLVDLAGRISDWKLGFITDEQRETLLRTVSGAKISVWIEVE